MVYLQLCKNSTCKLCNSPFIRLSSIAGKGRETLGYAISSSSVQRKKETWKVKTSYK